MPTLDLVIQENHGQFNFTSPVLPPSCALIVANPQLTQVSL